MIGVIDNYNFKEMAPQKYWAPPSTWSEEKKKCAEEIWQRFYLEYGYDAYFVAGIIGNMYGEGWYGMLGKR